MWTQKEDADLSLILVIWSWVREKGWGSLHLTAGSVPLLFSRTPHSSVYLHLSSLRPEPLVSQEMERDRHLDAQDEGEALEVYLLLTQTVKLLPVVSRCLYPTHCDI